MLPELAGKPIAVRFAPALRSHRGKIYSRHTCGEPVHAAADIRKRTVVLDSELTAQAGELDRILIHEIFHFAWVRLGNTRRNGYAELLSDEFRRRARGELGWSAEYRKQALLQLSRSGGEISRIKWREYVCESFCDTAAWRYSRIIEHNEFTLKNRCRAARERWLNETFGSGPILI